MNDEPRKAFDEADQQEQSSLLSELWQMVKENKKYWLIPLIVGLLIFGVLIMLGGTAVAPFIYTLF